jgi:hypothetical protein
MRQELSRQPELNLEQTRVLDLSGETLQILQTVMRPLIPEASETYDTTSPRVRTGSYNRCVSTSEGLTEIRATGCFGDDEVMPISKHEPGLPPEYDQIEVCYRGIVCTNDVADPTVVRQYTFWQVIDEKTQSPGKTAIIAGEELEYSPKLQELSPEALVKEVSDLEAEIEFEAALKDELGDEYDPEYHVKLQARRRYLLEHGGILIPEHDARGNKTVLNAAEVERLAQLLVDAELQATTAGSELDD